MVFYDKIAEMKSCKRTDDIKQGLEDFEDLNVLRYEFRFKKVKSISVGQSVERIYILRPFVCWY